MRQSLAAAGDDAPRGIAKVCRVERETLTTRADVSLSLRLSRGGAGAENFHRAFLEVRRRSVRVERMRVRDAVFDLRGFERDLRVSGRRKVLWSIVEVLIIGIKKGFILFCKEEA